MVKHRSAWKRNRPAGTAAAKRRARAVEPLEPRWVLAAPTLAAIQDVTLIAGAPLNIVLDGFDADGDTLSFSAISNNNNVTTYVPVGNDSLRLHVVEKNAQGAVLQDFGAMELQLFEDLAPLMTAHIKAYVQNGDYDGLTFHRIIENFMIQGGDPDGDGSGGLGTEIDDEYHLDLRFTSSGLLAMAKSNDDTNDSQFFITAGPTRWLDFNHTIFGFLTEGEAARQAIAGVSVNGSTPTNRVEIASATIFQDIENGVLRLSAPVGATGTAQITVTASDGNGGIAQRTFNVTIAADQAANNANPFLKPIADVNMTVGQTVNRVIEAVDAEGNAINFYFEPGLGSGIADISQQTATPVGQTAAVSIAITASLPGKKILYAVSRPSTYTQFQQSVIDLQVVNVNITPEAPTAIDLLDESDLGASSTDNFTSLDNSSPGKTLKFKVSGVWQGATVKLKIGDRVIGQATVPAATGGATPAKTDITITTNGTEALAAGVNSIIAEQSVDGLTSNYSQALDVAVNTPTALAAIANQSINEQAELSFFASATDPDAPARETLTYSIAPGGPPSALIDPVTGQFRWTPTESNGPGSFPTMIQVTDSFGTIVSRSFTITVNEVNQNPVVQTPPVLTVTAGDTATYQFVATDVDEPQNTLTFQLAQGSPAGASITSAGFFQFATARELAPGPYTFDVTVSDGAGGSTTKTLTVNVQPGPLLNPIGNKQVTEGQALLFTATAVPTNPGDKLGYYLSVDDPAFQFLVGRLDPDSGGFIWEPGEAHGPASFHLTVRVRDEAGHEDSETFTVTVLESNQPPQLPDVDDRWVNEREPISFGIVATDPDLPVNTLVYSLDWAPAGAAINPLTGAFTWTPSEAQGGGVFPVRVRASDGAGGSDTAEFDITVNKTNSDPILNAIAARSVPRGGTLGFQVAATDDDVPAQTLAYALGQGAPEGASIDPATGEFSWTPTAGVPAGVYAFDVIASDGEGGAATQTLEITVYDVPVEQPPPEGDPTDLPRDLAEAAVFPGSALPTSTTPAVGGSTLNNFALANGLPAAVNTIGQGLVGAQAGELPFVGLLAPENEEPFFFRSRESVNHLGADTGVGTHWTPGLHTVKRPKTDGKAENSEPDAETTEPAAATDEQPTDGRAAMPDESSRQSAVPPAESLNDAAVLEIELDAMGLAAPAPSSADAIAIGQAEPASDFASSAPAAALSAGVWIPLLATDVGKKTRDPGRIRRRRPR